MLSIDLFSGVGSFHWCYVQRTVSRHPLQLDGGGTRQTAAVRAEALHAPYQPQDCAGSDATGRVPTGFFCVHGHQQVACLQASRVSMVTNR